VEARGGDGSADGGGGMAHGTPVRGAELGLVGGPDAAAVAAAVVVVVVALLVEVLALTCGGILLVLLDFLGLRYYEVSFPAQEHPGCSVGFLARSITSEGTALVAAVALVEPAPGMVVRVD